MWFVAVFISNFATKIAYLKWNYTLKLTMS